MYCTSFGLIACLHHNIIVDVIAVAVILIMIIIINIVILLLLIIIIALHTHQLGVCQGCAEGLGKKIQVNGVEEEKQLTETLVRNFGNCNLFSVLV